jgi:hypothetical protein
LGNHEKLSAKFENPIAGFQAGLKGRPELLESGDQRGSSAITEADPNNFDFGVSAGGKMKKILVLADNHAVLSFGVPADLCIRSFRQADVENVLTIQATCLEILGKREGRLVIDKKIHEVWRTT